jgi:Ribbon-helix-helix protein, copG family
MDTQVNLTNELPIKPSSAKRITSIALRRDLLAKLDAHARKAKVSRNWVVERILEGWVESQEDSPAPRLRDHDGSWDGCEI